MAKSPSNILVIRFSSIGDIVLTSPALRCIKRKYPHSTLHFLSKKKFVHAFSANPFIDKEIYWEGKKTLKHLARQKFDLVVDLHNNLRTRRVWFYLLKQRHRPKWVRFNKINLAKWFAVRFKLKRVLPKKHIVHRYMKPLEKIGIPFDDKGLDYFIEQRFRIDIPKHYPGLEAKKYYAYAIGGQHETKKLPFHRQVDLLTQLNQTTILLGGKEDYNDAEELMKAVPNCHNACGRYNLQESASIIEQSRKVITHDTGLMHIAAALLKPIISIWGNTIPEFGMYPFYPVNFHDYENRQLEVDVYCRPCSKIGFKKCPYGHFKCMNKHDFTGLS
ncbi:glycosyltransferase family 9 protein [Bacteroidia bacterium]|nr:glycosyltransferase family 9 protein [Bacteroidia bacterium]